MRLIDYKCTVCGHEMKDREKKPYCCEASMCFSTKVIRMWGSPGITYKVDGMTGAQKGKVGRDGK